MSESAGRGSREKLVTALGSFLLGLVLLAITFLTGGSAAFGAALGGSKCLTGPDGVRAQYVLSDRSDSRVSVQSVILSGFDPRSCADLPVSVMLSGNTQGDPTAPGTVLSALDSRHEPCTGEALDVPARVTEGSITLAGCARSEASGRAGLVDIKHLTGLQVEVNGQSVQTQPGQVILGAQASAPGVDAPRTAGQTAPGVVLLPSVGGPHSMVLMVGLVFLVFGLVMLVDEVRLRAANARSGTM